VQAVERAVRAALAEGGVAPPDVVRVVLHAEGGPGDAAEEAALDAAGVRGERVRFKEAIGHLGVAAPAVELALGLAASPAGPLLVLASGVHGSAAALVVEPA
jgi:3-oxoacyl-(acyl-carrier-protein) synthase